MEERDSPEEAACLSTPPPAEDKTDRVHGSHETPEAALTGLGVPSALLPLRAVSAWLRASRLGLVVMALLVGGGAGLAAVGFRWLIFAFTWLATGYEQFGQQGRIGSLHFPWLGVWFLLLIPVLGGLLYGPLIQRFAREARGHGVPEVMLAVSENGGRIRPPVSVVKALASAMCIGVGGSVGREGPIVQIGSAFASTWARGCGCQRRGFASSWPVGRRRDLRDVQRPDHGAVLRLRDRPARVLARRAFCHDRSRRSAADLVGRAFFGSAPFFAAYTARPRASRQRIHLSARRRARALGGAGRIWVQDRLVQARGPGRHAVEGPARMGPAGGGRHGARSSAPGRFPRCTGSATR